MTNMHTILDNLEDVIIDIEQLAIENGFKLNQKELDLYATNLIKLIVRINGDN